MGTNENEWQGALSAIDLSAIEALKKLKQEHDQISERLKSMEAMRLSTLLCAANIQASQI